MNQTGVRSTGSRRAARTSNGSDIAFNPRWRRPASTPFRAVRWLSVGSRTTPAALVPAPDWSRRILDAHAEGYAAVGGSIAVDAGLLHRPPPALAPYVPGGGRNPAFEHPLLCPSLVLEITPEWAEPVEGLPALKPPPDEPWLYDGRITVRLQSGRRRG